MRNIYRHLEGGGGQHATVEYLKLNGKDFENPMVQLSRDALLYGPYIFKGLKNKHNAELKDVFIMPTTENGSETLR